MFDLDPRTVLVVSVFTGMLMAGVLSLLWRGYPATIKGMAEWTLAPVVLSLSALLFAVGGGAEGFFPVVLPGLLLLTGNGLFFWGMLRFLNRDWRPAAKVLGIAAVVLLPVLIWFAWIDPHHGARVFFTCLFLLGLGVAACALLLLKEQRSFAAWFLAAALLLWSFLLLVRMVTVWDEPPGRSVVVPPFYAAGTLLLLLAITVGTVLLASRRLQRELEYLAMHDSLTQALTRRAFVAACERELDRCRRHHRDMAMLLLDIDHFKAINDASGRSVGDEVILDFSARINDVLRRSDQLGRYEGVTFAVLLPETGPQEALAVAERIRSRTAAMHLSLPSYTVSIGATVNLPGEDTIDSLLRRVDMALHKAKKGGRNRVVFV